MHSRTCMRKVGKDVVSARLAVWRRRYDAPHSEVAPPGVPDQVVQERLPTLHSHASFFTTASHMQPLSLLKILSKQSSRTRIIAPWACSMHFWLSCQEDSCSVSYSRHAPAVMKEDATLKPAALLTFPGGSSHAAIVRVTKAAHSALR